MGAFAIEETTNIPRGDLHRIAVKTASVNVVVKSVQGSDLETGFRARGTVWRGARSWRRYAVSGDGEHSFGKHGPCIWMGSDQQPAAAGQVGTDGPSIELHTAAGDVSIL